MGILKICINRNRHMGETCCLCFPIECGVKTIAFFTILGAVLSGVNIYFDPAWAKLFAIEIGITCVMGAAFLYTLLVPGEDTRKFATMVWAGAVLVLGSVVYAYHIVNGDIAAYKCSPEKLEEMNQGIEWMEDEFSTDMGGQKTEAQCIEEQGSWLWVDFAIRLLWNLYFCHVLGRWAKHEDGYKYAN